MRKYYSLPLLFLSIAAGIGLFLRWQFIHPTPGVNYPYVLHSHSHVMFLGWVMNVIYLACVESYCHGRKHRIYLRLFAALQVCIVGMLISFPIQGYGVHSIIFSTLHTMLSLAFIVLFFHDTRHIGSVSIWFAKAGWLFFALSTLGPFVLGFLMANGMGQSPGYNLSIYYYLHFQYNGFFLFGCLSLFYRLLEQAMIPFDTVLARKFGLWTAVACLPAYLLSTLYLNPWSGIYVVAILAAIIQLYAFALFLRQVSGIVIHRLSIHLSARLLLLFVLTTWALKLLLQLVSAHPAAAQFAYAFRPVTIAYLHLVLLGGVTFFLLTWYMLRSLVHHAWAVRAFIILFTGFVGSETVLVLIPWWQELFNDQLSHPKVTWYFSILLFTGAAAFLFANVFRVNALPSDDKRQDSL